MVSTLFLNRKVFLLMALKGIKSKARPIVLGGVDVAPQATGFAAYRATVKVEKMKSDPEVSWLLEKPGLNIWYCQVESLAGVDRANNVRIGDSRHVMTYTIAAGSSFNMVLSHVDHSDPSTWKQETALQDMREHFKDWDPR
jgi:salicylate hydroxylase